MWVQVPSSAPKNTAEKDTFSAVFFYPSRRLGISSPHEVWWISSALWAVYHHRRCIPLRLDDIQNFVLMICNSFGIDDMQGYRLDLNVRMWYNTLKEVILCQKIIYWYIPNSLRPILNWCVKALKRRQTRFFKFEKVQAVFKPIFVRQITVKVKQTCFQNLK